MRIEIVLAIACFTVLVGAESRPIPPRATRSAIVCQLDGRVHVARAVEGAQEVALHDWLVEGTVLETGATGRVVLVFKARERYSLEKQSRGSVSSNKILQIKGTVHNLGRVPMIPTMGDTTVLAVKGNPGALIVRGVLDTPERFRDIQPINGGTVVASRAVLSFASKEPTGLYEVKLYNSKGIEVFSAEGDSTRYNLNPGLLAPDATYTWEVRQVGTSPGEGARAMFRTVAAGHADVRNRLQLMVEQQGDPELIILLEAMDRWLGLQ